MKNLISAVYYEILKKIIIECITLLLDKLFSVQKLHFCSLFIAFFKLIKKMTFYVGTLKIEQILTCL